MDDQKKLCLALQFLSLENRQKVSVLPTMPQNKELAIYETNIRTDNALFCFGYECYVCIERNKFGSEDKSHILSEIECLMDAMITHERSDWMWSIGDPGLSASPHLFWAILRRLAKDALKLRNWPEEVPNFSTNDFITVGQWVPKAKVDVTTFLP